MKKLTAMILAVCMLSSMLCLGASAEGAQGGNITKVEINEDNFFDYFEYVEFPEQFLVREYDTTGELSRIIASSCFMLRDRYRIAEARAGDCKADLHMTYTRVGYRLVEKAIDIKVKSCSYEIISKRPPYETNYHNEMLSGACLDDGTYYIWLGSDTVLNSVSAKLILEDSFELLYVSGTLYLEG